MSDKPSFKVIFKINGLFLRALISAGVAWLFWQGYRSGSFVMGGFAGMFAATGGFLLLKALFELFTLSLRITHWGRFKRKGAAPKADPVARQEELRAKGLIR